MLKIILIAFDHQKFFPIISFKREEIEKKGERETERERERERGEIGLGKESSLIEKF